MRALTKQEHAVFLRLKNEGYGINEARKEARRLGCLQRAEQATTVDELRFVLIDYIKRDEW